MNSPDVLDFDALFRPISTERPTGEDLRADSSAVSPYYQIKDARAAARAAERAGVLGEDGRPAVPAEWQTVLRLAPQILTTKAKDLEIVAWLIEALVRYHGFAGLRDGFRLAHGLVANFWDGLYPTPDEDGIATRVAPFVGLNGGESEGTLAAPIALAPITAEGESGAFGLWRYARVRDLQRTAGAGGGEGEGGAVPAVGTVEQFETTVRQTPPEFFQCLLGDVEAALGHFDRLTAELDNRAGGDSPPSSALRSALENARQTITHVMREVAGVMPDTGATAATEAAAPTAAAGAAGSGGAAARPAAAAGEIRTRDDAFRLMSRAADWFRDNEPHSPLSSLLNQAVRWGRLPLRQLIEELIPDASARDHFGLLTGLGKSTPAESNE